MCWTRDGSSGDNADGQAHAALVFGRPISSHRWVVTRDVKPVVVT